MEETITLEGAPYFIIENDSGIFRAVKSLRLITEEDKFFWNKDYDEGIGKLELGLDIQEVPNRGVTLTLWTPNSQHTLPFFVNLLKRHATICGCDYFSYERYGNFIYHFLCNDGSRTAYEVQPRLFRKIVND